MQCVFHSLWNIHLALIDWFTGLMALDYWLTGSLFPPWLNITSQWFSGFLDSWLCGFLDFCFSGSASSFGLHFLALFCPKWIIIFVRKRLYCNFCCFPGKNDEFLYLLSCEFRELSGTITLVLLWFKMILAQNT